MCAAKSSKRNGDTVHMFIAKFVDGINLPTESCYHFKPYGSSRRLVLFFFFNSMQRIAADYFARLKLTLTPNVLNKLLAMASRRCPQF